MIKFKEYLTELNAVPKELRNFIKSVEDIKVLVQKNKWEGDLSAYMYKHGFRTVGRGGVYASVFINSDYDYAIKVFIRDVAYLRYLKWVRKNQGNKYVPKLRGKIIKLTNMIYAQRIKKYKPFDDSDKSNEFLAVTLYPDEYLNCKIESRMIYLKNLRYDDKDLISLCKELNKHKNISDVRVDNIMMDGNTPILTDPWANKLDADRVKLIFDTDDLSELESLF